jgi:hypothetical protein
MLTNCSGGQFLACIIRQQEVSHQHIELTLVKQLERLVRMCGFGEIMPKLRQHLHHQRSDHRVVFNNKHPQGARLRRSASTLTGGSRWQTPPKIALLLIVQHVT